MLKGGVTCIDVGAGYFAHPAWLPLADQSTTSWIAIDPAGPSLDYLECWGRACSAHKVVAAVGSVEGESQLYVCNASSGSSLLRPRSSGRTAARLPSGYFEPVEVTSIWARSLNEIVSEAKANEPFFLKLDTQGTELAILTSIDGWMEGVVAVECEVPLRTEELYEGEPRFQDYLDWALRLGFELSLLEPIALPPRKQRNWNGSTVCIEGDALFLLRADVALQRSEPVILGLLKAYHLYGFFDDAMSFAEAVAVRPRVSMALRQACGQYLKEMQDAT